MRDCDYQYIEVTEIKARCTAGAHIHECIREAVIMAMTERRIVRFDHNGTEYVADPKRISNQIYKAKPNEDRKTK